jgi:6-pyruvoyltetrahydropterin/6-carboxytetrahydropterin synthase
VEIACEFGYEAAHWLPNVPVGHKCQKLHGHSYRLVVTVEGPVDPILGWVIDFADVRGAVEPFIGVLDHSLLNDLIDNPTVENQLRWLWEKITLEGMSRLVLSETESTSATYYGPDDE